MPESEYDPDDALVPATPAGYRDPTTFEYSVPALVGIGVVLTAVGLLAFGAVLNVAQGTAIYEVLVVPIPLVAYAASVGLVFNTAGAAGDVHLRWFLSRLPEGTLLYDSDMRHSYVFEPSSESELVLESKP